MTLLILLVTKPDRRQGAKKGLSNGFVSNKCQKQVFNDLTFVTTQVWMVLLLCIDALMYSYYHIWYVRPSIQFNDLINWFDNFSSKVCLSWCLTTFSASRASQFRTDKVTSRFFMISWNQNWSGKNFCKHDYHKMTGEQVLWGTLEI